MIFDTKPFQLTAYGNTPLPGYTPEIYWITFGINFMIREIQHWNDQYLEQRDWE